MPKKATSKQIDKAYSAYRKRLKGLKKNPTQRQMLTKGEFIRKNYPDFGKTTRTSHVERGLSAAGMSYKDIQKLRSK